MVISLAGTWLQSTAESWLVFQLTNSAFLLGLVGFLSTIPMFILSLFGGVLADRMDKRRILIVTQSLFMTLAFVLAVSVHLKLITPLQIMVVALLNGVVMAFDAPSRQAVVVELVGKNHLPNAIALNSVAFNSSRIIGPVAAAILISAIGMSGCFYLNAISFLAPIAALFFIKINPLKVKKDKSALNDLKEGLFFVKGNKPILILITMAGIVSLFGVSYIILMPMIAKDVLGLEVGGLGMLMAASGLGALGGALTLARLGDFKAKGRLLIASVFMFSVSLTLFSVSAIFYLSLFLLTVIGYSSVTSVALINTILQGAVPDAFRGRVMSVFMLIFAGIMPFGNLIAGVLAQKAGVSFTVFLSGILCTLFFLILNFVYPQIREM